VRVATPLMERNSLLSARHNGILGDEGGDLLFQGVDLVLDEGKQLIDEDQHGGVGDQAALVALRGAGVGELAQARDQSAAVLLVGGRRRGGRAGADLGEPGDEAGVDGVGFFVPADALSEAAYLARVEDGHRQAVGREQREGLLLVAAGGFHGDQLGPMGVAEGGQLADAFHGVGENVPSAVRADAGGEGARGNIHSTNDSGHGNLPCMCDRSHATVRSCVTRASGPCKLSTGGEHHRADGRRSPAGEPMPRFPHCNNL